MTSCLTITTLIAVFFTSVLLPPKIEAKEKHKKSRVTSNEQRDDKKSRVTSNEHRNNKKFGVYGEIGLLNILSFGQGIRGSLYLARDHQIELNYFKAEFSIFGFSTAHSNFSARYKHFVGNSFNIYGGTGSRTLTSTTPRHTGKDSLNSAAVIIEGGIGNHWAFGAFSMGCDWFGLSHPVISLSNSEKFNSTRTEQEKDQDRNDFKGETNRTDLMLVRFYLGAHF